jgi:hypothetical protein
MSTPLEARIAFTRSARDVDARLRDELFRHGALLSEILARTLRASWVDVSPSEPGFWAMLVPPATRTFPIGRVHRFFTVGTEEKDLVAYCLDLESWANVVRAPQPFEKTHPIDVGRRREFGKFAIYDPR